MALDKVTHALAKDFVVAHVVTDEDEGGEELLEAYRQGRSGGVPWFVFTDADGSSIVDSSGPNGNVGCPYTDEEIADFAAMLRKAAVRLDEEDIAALSASLVENRKKNS